MKTNIKNTPKRFTHEGAVAKNITVENELRRSVMSCMLWENNFYENGVDVANRIASLIPKVNPRAVADIAIEAREKMKLRHAPLYIVRVMATLPSHKFLVAETLERVIQRADELSEFLAIYWKDGRCPISKQVKKGLAAAFTKFNEYSLAKYNRDGAIKLRDVLFLVHAKPKDDAQADLWKRLVTDELKTPDTWEVELSASKDKLGSWTRLLSENKLGGLAMLRNLRNMTDAGVSRDAIRRGLENLNAERVLPFRFISAAQHAPQYESELEKAMFRCLEGMEKLQGRTVLLIDTSGSMSSKVSGKSDISRLDAASGLAMLLREICDDVQVYTFNYSVKELRNRRGFALRDEIGRPNGGTALGAAVTKINSVDADRLIVLTDEQSQDRVGSPKFKKSYMINVASYRNGVGYGNGWTHIDGWSEAIVDYIRNYESQ